MEMYFLLLLIYYFGAVNPKPVLLGILFNTTLGVTRINDMINMFRNKKKKYNSFFIPNKIKLYAIQLLMYLHVPKARY